MPKPIATHRIVDINVDKELEVSWVPRGSNPFSKVILRKSADQHEELNMLKSVLLAKILMNGGAMGAYVEGLSKEEDLTAFLEKDEAGQRAEADSWVAKTNWVAKKDDPEPDADDKKPPFKKDGATDDELMKAELAKNPLMRMIVERMEKAETATADALKRAEAAEKSASEVAKGAVVTTLQKRAETEFKGLGVGVEKTVEILKGIAALPESVQKDIEAIMKTNAELSKLVAGSIGLRSLAKDANSAFSQLQKLAEDVSKSEKISFEQALHRVSNDPANGDLVERADAEEQGALAAAAA